MYGRGGTVFFMLRPPETAGAASAAREFLLFTSFGVRMLLWGYTRYMNVCFSCVTFFLCCSLVSLFWVNAMMGIMDEIWGACLTGKSFSPRGWHFFLFFHGSLESRAIDGVSWGNYLEMKPRGIRIRRYSFTYWLFRRDLTVIDNCAVENKIFYS